MNRLISKGVPNIYLKVTIEKNWRSQNFDFLSLKICILNLITDITNRYINRYWILILLVAT